MGYSSAYYKERRDQASRTAKNCDKYADQLEKILSRLVDDSYGKISPINKQLSQLEDDLDGAVRHNSTFHRHVNEAVENKEKTTSADNDLSTAINELEDEIRQLRSTQRNAEAKKEQYNRQYHEKKREEAKEFLDDIF